jgi:2-amino-4-hydroxy-6-hydroxymethyldihydropteridine diphosphokinase
MANQMSRDGGPATEAGVLTTHRAFVALGSNIDAERNLPAAVRALAALGQVTGASRVYETAPVGNPADPRFLNAAVRLETTLPPDELLRGLKLLETRLGRVRSDDPNAPRTIDLDLLTYDETALTVAGRRLPNPEILVRSFVAVPLSDIAPDERHVEDGRTYAQIAASLAGDAGDMAVRPDVRLTR